MRTKNAEAAARYRERHPERVKQSQLKYRLENRAVCNMRHRRWADENPVSLARSKFAARLRRYGIDVEDWARAFHRQRGCCAGCCEPLRDGWHTAVDHCHRTNRFRGLLCIRYNRSIGVLLESTRTLRRLADYLEAHRGA